MLPMTFTPFQMDLLIVAIVVIPAVTNAVVHILAAIKGTAAQDIALAAQTQQAADHAAQLARVQAQSEMHDRQIRAIAAQIPKAAAGGKEPPQN